MDNKGQVTELGELIADDGAIDLDPWLLGCPQRLVGIAFEKGDQKYLERYRRKAQKRLI